MEESERVLCSAVWYKDLPTPIYRPTNIDRGIVFSGHRHPHCVHQMVAMTGKRQAEVGEYEQGYLTSFNRFVNREEAAKIVLANGQVKKMQYGGGKRLFSEDLYD
jgi:hypothetical protein